MRLRVLLRLVVAASILSQPLLAQLTEDSRVGESRLASAQRPSVGLALSGGGALGLAHIGVLRYMEEHKIPVDALAGTSMGGLVGGFYASGMDSRQLTDVAENANWNVLLSPTSQFRDRPVVEKQSWNQSSGDLTLRLGHRFSLPQGINQGEALSLLLSRNTVAYGGIVDFDDLPTPFRCVATDLVSADAVVLDRGSLAKAMRATMALPAVFTPVVWDDKILVDGGIVQNLPVEVVRSMGAQKTIAVALQTGKPRAKDLTSLTSIAMRSISVAVEQNERRSAALADVVIVVDVKKFTGLDYTRARDIIRAGYEAAQSKAAELQQFELSAGDWEQFQAARKRRMRQVPHEGQVVEVAAQTPAFRQDATEELARKLGKRPASEEQVEDTLTGIVAATRVPGASYQWAQDQNGYQVEFLRRPGETILIRPSFDFGISSGEPSRAALRLAISRIGEDAYKSRILATATIGYDPGLKLEYYHPVHGTGYFVAPGFIVSRTNFNSYEGGVRSRVMRDRFAGSFYAGLGTWRFVQLRAGVVAGYDSHSEELVTDGITSSSEGFGNPEVAWIYNTQNSGGFPTSGLKVEGATGYSFRTNAFPYLRNELTSFVRISKELSWIGTSDVATSFGRKLSFYDQFTAGGAGQLSAFRYQEFHANTMVTAGTGLLFHASSRKLPIRPGIAVMYEGGRFDLGSRGWQTHHSATTGVFFPTPIGTAGFALSFNEDGKARFRISLGSLGRSSQ